MQPGTKQLHARARDLLGKVFRIYDGEDPANLMWSDADLHDLKAMGDAIGGDYQLKGREAVDHLDQIRHQLRMGHFDWEHLARTAAMLDDLTTAADNEGL